jgi:hypothetical protein
VLGDSDVIDGLRVSSGERRLSSMPQHHDFTDENFDAAIDFTIEDGAEDRGQTISYSRVFDAAGLPPPQDIHFGGESQLVTLFMVRLHFRCRERTLPPLDTLVVYVAGERTGFPGAGYFRVNGQAGPVESTNSSSWADASDCLLGCTEDGVQELG